jgi:hypothetical protein
MVIYFDFVLIKAVMLTAASGGLKPSMSLLHILKILVGITISILVTNQRYLVGGRFFHAISKNVKGMAINPVAIRIGSITAGSSDLPIARKYGNG